jgi:hypothetical protein
MLHAVSSIRDVRVVMILLDILYENMCIFTLRSTLCYYSVYFEELLSHLCCAGYKVIHAFYNNYKIAFEHLPRHITTLPVLLKLAKEIKESRKIKGKRQHPLHYAQHYRKSPPGLNIAPFRRLGMKI